MKKIYSFIALIIFSCLSINAQSFIRNYIPSSGSSTLNYYYSVHPTSSGNYLVGGQIKENSGASSDMIISLLNQNGEEIWSKKYGDVGQPEGILTVNEINGNYYALGWTNNSGGSYNEILIIAMDPLGNILPGWPKQYQSVGSTNHKYCYRLMQVGNKMVISGNTSSGGFDNLLFAIDFNGNIVWDHTYNVIGNDKAGYDLLHLQNGSLLSSGNLYDGSYDLQLMFTDTTGNYTDLYRYNCSGQDIYAGQVIDLGVANGLIIIGNYNSSTGRDIYATRINYNGDVQWATRYGLNSQEDYVADAVLLDDGTIGIGGYTKNPSSSSTCGLFMRINTSGSILSQFGYQPTNTANENYKFFGLAKNSDGDVVLSGLGVSPGSGSDGLLFMVMSPTGLGKGCGQIQLSLTSMPLTLVKTEPPVNTGVGFGLGSSAVTFTAETLTEDAECGLYIGVEENSPHLPVLVYPTPTNDFVQVNIPHPSEEGTFEILNMDGKIIRTGIANSDKLIIDVQDFASGVYIIHLYLNKITLHGKLIKN